MHTPTEDWTQVTDRGTRRRIQNRISQQKHRKRARTGDSDSKQRSSELIWTQPHTNSRPPPRVRDQASNSGESVWSQSSSARSPQLLAVISSATASSSPTSSSQIQQPQQQDHHQETQINNIDPCLLSPTSQMLASPLDFPWPTNDPILGGFDDGSLEDFFQTHSIMPDSSVLPLRDSPFSFQRPPLDRTQSLPTKPVDMILTTTPSQIMCDDPSALRLPTGQSSVSGGSSSNSNSGSGSGSGSSSSSDPDLAAVGLNALHLAAHHGRLSIARLLLSMRPRDVDTVTADSGQSALHLAAAEDHLDVVRELLERGADALLQDNDGQTALHIAATWGSLDTVRMLIDWRPDGLGIGDHAGQRPLHRAVVNGHEEIVRLLLEKGADPGALVC